jgi:hypothetical protein
LAVVSLCKKRTFYTKQKEILDFIAPPVIGEANLGGGGGICAKVYNLTDVDDIPLGEPVSLGAIVRQRWVEETNFYNCERRTNFVPDNEPYIPTKYLLHVKMSARSDSPSTELFSLYSSRRHCHVYPLALLPGRLVRIDNAEKVVSEKGHVYFRGGIHQLLLRLDS